MMGTGEARHTLLNRTAAVVFHTPHEANRRIAGLPAAARIVHALAQAGIKEVRLVLPQDAEVEQPVWLELLRLAPDTRILVANTTAGEDLILPGNRLSPAELLSQQITDGGIALDHKAAKQILRTTGKASDGPVSRWINRPVSRALSTLLLSIPGIRPIHATLGTALLALAMLAALTTGGELGLIVGAILYQTASIFDGVDGEIARATFRTSRAGAVIDSFVDVFTNIGFILGLSSNLAGNGSDLALVYSSVGGTLFLVGMAIISWRASQVDRPFTLDVVKQQYRRQFSGSSSAMLMRILITVASRDFFALLFAILILVGLPMMVLALFSAAAVVWVVFVLYSILLPVPVMVDVEVDNHL